MNKTKTPFDPAPAHRHFSGECFNRVWTFMEQPARTEEQTDEMTLMAQASLWHWTQRADCTAENRSIGHWQISRAYCLAGQGENAMRAARKCLSEATELTPFFIGFAHEAIARAALLVGDHKTFQQQMVLGRAAAANVTDAEDRKPLEDDLGDLAGQAAT